MEWKDVTPAEAEKNKYYGLGGWLLVFYALAVVGFLGNFLILTQPATLKELYGDNASLMMASSVIQGVLLLPFIILAPKKSPLMPRATISAYSLAVALNAVVTMIVGPADLLPQLLVNVAFVAAFSWYLRKSKRVNVTYLPRVPVEAAEVETGH